VSRVSGAPLTRIVHEFANCERRSHAISGRARSFLLAILSRLPASGVAARGQIWRALDALATHTHE
jgi:hypothetical protein